MKRKLHALLRLALALILTTDLARAQSNLPPVVVMPPQNVLVPSGGTAAFSISVSGSAPFNYQWRFDGINLNDGGVFSGSETTNLILTGVTSLNSGNYDVVVSNAWGSVTSSVATLTLAYPPAITAQPASIITNVNTYAGFAVTATGMGTLSYQWQYNGVSLPPFSQNVQGTTTAHLFFDNVRATNAGPYDVIISNAWGSVTSSIVTLSISYAPVITNQPASLVLTNVNTAIFSAGATGTGPLTYQWLYNGKFITNNVITTVAGTNLVGYGGDGGSATNARLYFPAGLALDAHGDLFIADTGNQRIRKINSQGIISTVAGNGSGGFNGNGLLATNSALDLSSQFYISGLAADSADGLFFADTFNGRIRLEAYDSLITVAGTGFDGYSGDGGEAYTAALYYPSGLAADSNGNIYFADTLNERIRKVDVNDIITTVAGNGSTLYSGDGYAATNAGLNYPSGVAVDGQGNLFFADTRNNRIRRVDTNGIITTVAGSSLMGYSGDGGLATNAALNYPAGVTVDANGNLFIADANNNRIRKVTPGGIITTVAGGFGSGSSGDGIAATNAYLFTPASVVVDPAGDLFIADTRNSRVRKVTPQGPVLTLANVTSSNNGNYQLIVSNPYGSATSAVATLTVAIPPSILGQPADEIVFAGGVANFSVTAAGTPPLSSQWLFDGTNLELAYEPNLELTLESVEPEIAGTYQVIITNLFGSVTSRLATLTVALPKISVATTNSTVTITLTSAPKVSSRVLATTNLTPPVVWTPIYTNISAPASPWNFVDTNTTASPARFYIISTP